jgi:hypothetical protein
MSGGFHRREEGSSAEEDVVDGAEGQGGDRKNLIGTSGTRYGRRGEGQWVRFTYAFGSRVF